MLEVFDTADLILELLIWVGLVPGLLLLLVGWILRQFQIEWRESQAVVYTDGNKTGYRWFDHEHEVHETLVSEPLIPGTDVVLYYNVRDPSRWRMAAPEQAGKLPLVLGWILTGVGLAAALVNFLLLFG